MRLASGAGDSRMDVAESLGFVPIFFEGLDRGEAGTGQGRKGEGLACRRSPFRSALKGTRCLGCALAPPRCLVRDPSGKEGALTDEPRFAFFKYYGCAPDAYLVHPRAAIEAAADCRQPKTRSSTSQMQPNQRRNRRSMAGLSAALVLSSILAFIPRASSGADSPRTVVELNSQKVLAILNSGDSDDEKIKHLEQLAYTAIDFDTVCRLVLAKYWKQFTPEQRQQFVDEFKRALTVSYGRRIGQFGQEKVVILGERQEPLGDVTVQSHIVGGKAGDIKVDYRLRQKDGTWYVIDVIVEGVSIVSSYRTQFQEIIGQGGPDRLLAELHQKNTSGEGLAPVETTAKDGGTSAR